MLTRNSVGWTSLVLLALAMSAQAQTSNPVCSDVIVAHKVGSNCTQTECAGSGGCAICVDLVVTLPPGTHQVAIHCLTVANYPKDYQHGDLHEVACTTDNAWSIFDNPSDNGNSVSTTFHNRSSDRDRDVQLCANWR